MRAAARVYTLGDLLDEPGLGLELVVGDERARSLPISGAHSIEVEHPSRWLDRGWLVLTTGVRLRRNARAQRELIAELDRSGATAIAFGVGDVFKRVPPAMLAEARERDFPLVVIPLPTPFRAVIGAVYRATLSADQRTFQRLIAMQRYLTDALGDEHPLETVIERLAELVDATAGVIGPDGGLETASGPLPAAALWREISRRPATLLEFDAEGRHCVAAPVKTRSGDERRWLVVASRGAGFADDLTKAATQATTPLLSAIDTLDRVSRDNDRAARAAVLDGILGSPEPVEQRSLAMRASALGVDLGQPTKTALVASGRDRAGAEAKVPLGELGDRLQRRLRQMAVPHLATRREGGLCLLVQGDSGRLREALGELCAGEPAIVIGCGREVDSPGRVRASLRDAELALECIDRERGERFLDFDDFDLSTFLVGGAAAEAIAPKVDEMLGPLHANEPLLATLRAYFDRDLSVARTARALEIHPNSLRYRLGRIEALIGRSLRRPATIAALHLALLAAAADPPRNGAGEGGG